MTIGTICNRDTVFTTRNSSIVDAAQLMRDHHVGDLVVVDEHAGRRIPVGIVTDRDLVIEILARRVEPGSVTVGDVMSGELVTARESDGLFDTLQRMRAKGVRRRGPGRDHRGGRFPGPAGRGNQRPGAAGVARTGPGTRCPPLGGACACRFNLAGVWWHNARLTAGSAGR